MYIYLSIVSNRGRTTRRKGWWRKGVNGQGREKRWPSLILSFWSWARATAWTRDKGCKASTSQHMFGERPDMKQLRRKGVERPTMRFARASNSARYKFTDPCCDKLNKAPRGSSCRDGVKHNSKAWRKATDHCDTSTETNLVQQKEATQRRSSSGVWWYSKKLIDLEYRGRSIGVVESRNIKIHARRRWSGWMGGRGGFQCLKARYNLIEPRV